MKTNLLLIIVALLVSGTTHLLAQQTIQSTEAGGLWHDPNTWVGLTIPGETDDVIINGPVVQAYTSGYTILPVHCSDLTITSTGSLRNGSYGGGYGVFPVYVHGSAINFGIVENGSEDVLKMFVYGDLTNNNIWMPVETELAISENHNLSLAEGMTLGSKIIVSGNTNITALTDLVFTCDWHNDGGYNRSHLMLNGHTFIVGNHALEMRNCLINSGTLIGDFEILGTFSVGYNINDTLKFDGNVTVTDTLMANIYGGGYGIYKLRIDGNLTNNGVVKDNMDTKAPLNDDDLEVLITGNIINNGSWSCRYVKLVGTETQLIKQETGKFFDSYFSDLNPASDVVAQSEISILEDFDLNGAKLNMAGNTLTIYGWLYDGTIENTNLNYGFLNNLTSTGSLTINGVVTIETGNIFQGDVIVNDTLQSIEYGGGSITYTLQVQGDITNYGLIRNINDGDLLAVEITGNIINNGSWSCRYVKLVGTETQLIKQETGMFFDSYFSDLNPASDVVAQSDISIMEDFDLNGANLNMAGNTLTIYGWLYDGTIENTNLNYGFLNNLTSTGSLTINGVVTIENGNIFQGDVIVNDTLQSIEYGGGSITYTLQVQGDITNYGLIRNINDGDLLAIEITGNIDNQGKWQNSYTRFTGAQQKSIHQLSGTMFHTNFSDADSTSMVLATSDLKIAGNFNLMRAALQMDYHEINISGTLYNGTVKSAIIKNATLNNVTAFGNVEIRGIVVIDDGNEFYGDLLVTDTLQSQLYGGGSHTYPLYNYGDIENNGLIRNEPIQDENFALYIQGDIINKGKFTNYANYQLFYPNDDIHKVSCLNKGAANWQFDGSTITGIGAGSYSFISGGGIQTVAAGESYDVSVQFTPADINFNAQLNINCAEIGSLSTVYLIGYNENTTVGIEEEHAIPDQENPEMLQNWPNPFSGNTSIHWQQSENANVLIKIFDFSGREIGVLIDCEQSAGKHSFDFDGSKLPSGIYYLKGWINNRVLTCKMLKL